MISFALYMLSAVAFALITWLFYKSKNGFVRLGMLWLFGTLSFGLSIRGLSFLLPHDILERFGELIGITAVGSICLVAWIFLVFLWRRYK